LLRAAAGVACRTPRTPAAGVLYVTYMSVTPSRFESFGLMLVEGMMFGKPVIGCRAGGMVEVVENGKTGLLAEPGEVASLEACLNRLIEDPELRARLGASARKCYENCFKAHQMTAKVVAFLSKIGDSWNCARSSPVPTDVNI
jgi:glycogen synthase